MRKSFLSAILLFSFAIVKAQKIEKNEIKIAYSDATFIMIGNVLADAFSDVIVSGISGVKYEDAKSKAIGMFEVGYRYKINERWKVGGDLSYLKLQNTFHASTSNSNSVTRNTNYVMALGAGEFSYIRKPLLNFYCSAAVGLLGGSTKQTGGSYHSNEVGFAYQINPAGLRVGKKFGAFLELGFGYKGIATMGLNYRF